MKFAHLPNLRPGFGFRSSQPLRQAVKSFILVSAIGLGLVGTMAAVEPEPAAPKPAPQQFFFLGDSISAIPFAPSAAPRFDPGTKSCSKLEIK